MAATVLRFRAQSATSEDTAWPSRSGDATGEVASASGQMAAADYRETARRVDHLEKEIIGLRARAGGAVIVVDTLAPESLDLVRPFHVNVEPDEEGFRAFFADANLMSFGETAAESVWNLKDLIVATFETLSEVGEARLGPGPTRQLAVLRQFIRK